MTAATCRGCAAAAIVSRPAKSSND
jgi:hypothetical protein